ncbi:MAG: hypothetical protein N2745_06470 [Syntrophorhabdaceae bacterium]|nr:hypothetical protein [Syntrophorhabdaceae bacterium]
MESGGVLYYLLSGRYLLNPIYRVLGLEEFEEKLKIRNILKNATVNRSFLASPGLELIDAYKEQMHFNREEAGLILSSLIRLHIDYRGFFERIKGQGFGIDIKPILRLLFSEEKIVRSKALELLVEINDKDMVNPLLFHLKREDEP